MENPSDVSEYTEIVTDGLAATTDEAVKECELSPLPCRLARALAGLEGDLFKVTGRGIWGADVILVGTVAMSLAGLKGTPQDIDVFARPWTYKALWDRRDELGWLEVPSSFGTKRLQKFISGVRVEVMGEWANEAVHGHSDGQIVEAFNHILSAQEWPVIDLDYLLDWKLKIGRAKDANDVAILKHHLSRDDRFVIQDSGGDYER